MSELDDRRRDRWVGKHGPVQLLYPYEFEGPATREQQLAAYEHYVAQGMTPADAGTTHQWHCTECGAETYQGRGGGEFNPCGCPDRADKTELYTILAGVRRFVGMEADITNKAPASGWAGSKDAKS